MLYAVIFICFCGLMLLLTVYSYSIYKNLSFSLKSSDKDYKPNTALFVPCKHYFDSLKINLESVLKLNYQGKYRVIYIVESKEDGAYGTIEEITSKNKNTEMIIAGTAKNNSQKNFNILRAIEKLDVEKRNNYEVYAFFDSDHKAPADWLTKLVQTLTLENTEISTFHSVKNPKKLFPLGNIMYSMLNNYIYGINTFSNQAWGGSLAMKKSTYEKYKIGAIWDSAVSHDCPINGIKAKVTFNPQCLPDETHYSYTIGQFISWSTRQFTNWKHYSLNFWCLSFFSIMANVIMLYAFFASFLFDIMNHSGSLITLIIGIYILSSYAVLSVFISFKMKNSILYFIIHYFFIALFLNVLYISFLRSIFNKNIHWAGKKYSISKKGVVLDIKSSAKN